MSKQTPAPYRADARLALYHGDSLNVLKALPDNSVDSIVTDPPYGLEFMGREWDAPWKGKAGKAFSEIDAGTLGGFSRLPNHSRVNNVKCGTCDRWKFSSNPCDCLAPNFPNARLQAMTAFQDWFHAIASELMRVLKPGGHALIFGGTRTYHRMVCAVEDAGFEVRDYIEWLYGSGFPKSLNVSKAVDAQLQSGNSGSRSIRLANETRPGDGTIGVALPVNGILADKKAEPRVSNDNPATDAAREWAGWGTALKPAHEPILVARKPLVGTVAQNVLAHGTGGLNIDGCRVGTETVGWGGGANRVFATSGGGREQEQYAIPGNARPATGRFPANLVLTHAPGCRATGETRSVKSTAQGAVKVKASAGKKGGAVDNAFGAGGLPAGRAQVAYGDPETGLEETPVYQCAPGCPVAELDAQSGNRPGGAFPTQRGRGVDTDFGAGLPTAGGARQLGDAGGASRFFTATETDADPLADVVPFRYEAKAATRERPVHPETGKGHPTVKPLELMRWLVRLVTPEGGTVLEPFAGSGATVEAALLEGKKVIAIELMEEHLPLIDARIDRFDAGKSPVKKAPTKRKAKVAPAAQDDLFSAPDGE